MQPTSFSVAAAATILVLCLAADGAPEPGRAGRLGARLRLRYRMQRGQSEYRLHLHILDISRISTHSS